MFNIDFNKLFRVQNNGDKIAHFIAGAIIALAVIYATNNEIYALFAGIGAGLAKEVYDYYKTEADGFDFFATVLGTFLAVMVNGLFT